MPNAATSEKEPAPVNLSGRIAEFAVVSSIVLVVSLILCWFFFPSFREWLMDVPTFQPVSSVSRPGWLCRRRRTSDASFFQDALPELPCWCRRDTGLAY